MAMSKCKKTWGKKSLKIVVSGWSYGKNYAGKVKTYKFDEAVGVKTAASSITTAQKQTTQSTFAFRTAESFLQNLNANKETVDITNYKEGQRVYHKKFGEGTISSIEPEGDDAKVDISFDKVGHKRLMAKFAGLEILD